MMQSFGWNQASRFSDGTLCWKKRDELLLFRSVLRKRHICEMAGQTTGKESIVIRHLLFANMIIIAMSLTKGYWLKGLLQGFQGLLCSLSHSFLVRQKVSAADACFSWMFGKLWRKFQASVMVRFSKHCLADLLTQFRVHSDSIYKQ